MSKSIGQFYSSLPRAGRWLVWFVVLVLGFIFVNDYLLKLYDRWDARANQLESQLLRLRDLGSSESDEGRVIATGMTGFGRPALPSSPAMVAQSLTRRVNDVFDLAGVDDRTQIEKNASFKSKQTDERLERIILEVTFEAEPHTITQIIADLESSAEVTTVSRIRIDKGNRSGDRASNTQTVRATIAAEAWARNQ